MSGIFHLPLLTNSVPEQGNGDYRVRFYDYDGTLLKEEWVQDAVAPTAPNLPTHENLTFYEWNNDFSNPSRDMDIGAIYTSAHTYITVNICAGSGLYIALSLSKTAGTDLTVYWGDGTSVTNWSSGNITIGKNYSTYGTYTIRIESVSNFYLGHGSAGVISNNHFITKAIVGEKAILNTYCFNAASAMETLVLNTSITSVPQSTIRSCYELKHLNLPKSFVTINQYGFAYNVKMEHCIVSSSGLNALGVNAFDGCTGLKDFILPPFGTLTALNSSSFQDCYSLTEFKIQKGITLADYYFLRNSHRLTSLEFPSTLTSLNGNAFVTLSGIREFVFNSTTPPSLSSSALFNHYIDFKKSFKIFVPDASVNAYKTATNWVTAANYIYPLSER